MLSFGNDEKDDEKYSNLSPVALEEIFMGFDEDKADIIYDHTIKINESDEQIVEKEVKVLTTRSIGTVS